jgi:uncharacterized membrane-anchored protein YjiN (DUF445 family)
MTKSEKIISEFFKPYFEKHSELNSIWFLIYDLEDGIYLADEDCGINGLRWDELSDEKMNDSSYKIQDAIEILKESKVDVSTIIEDLNKLVIKLQKDADDSNPLNKIMEDVWNNDVREKLSKKVIKHLSKEIPWKYVDWCQCNVNRDGGVEIEEHQR